MIFLFLLLRLIFKNIIILIIKMTKKISIFKYDQLLKRKLSIIVSEINNLFNNSNNEIIKMLINKNIKTRKNKLTFNDALLYKFKCAFEINIINLLSMK